MDGCKNLIFIYDLLTFVTTEVMAGQSVRNEQAFKNGLPALITALFPDIKIKYQCFVTIWQPKHCLY